MLTEGLSRLENVLQQFQVEEEVRVREKTKLLESKLRQLEAQLLERATAPADEKVFVCDISLVSVRVCVRVGFAVLVAHVSVAVLCFFALRLCFSWCIRWLSCVLVWVWMCFVCVFKCLCFASV